MQRELIISIIIFVLSCVGTAASYYTILQHAENENTLVSGITPGRHNYSVLEENKCIGWANYELIRQGDISEIRSSGNFNIKFQNEIADLNYAFESSYNSIGQMGGALLKINIKDNFILFGAVNIDPIKVTIKSNLLQMPNGFSFDVPGPVELKKSRGGIYSITGINASKFQNSPFKLPLDIVERDDSECENNKDYSFDITPLVDKARAVIPGYMKP